MSGPETQQVLLDLSHSEALVLYELLADFNDQPVLQIPSTAERLALFRLHGAIEKKLVDPFCTDYRELLENARRNLRDQYGDAS